MSPLESREVSFIMNSIGRALTGTLGIVLLLIGENNGRVVITKPEEGCSVLVNGGFAEPQPLILSADSRGQHGFIYPPNSESGYLVAESGESFRLACPGSKLHLNTIDPHNETLVTCVGENKFLLQGAELEESFDKISCEKYPESVAKRTGQPCDGGSMLEIGFDLRTQANKKQKRGEFYPLIDLCHDDTLGNTLYAHAKIVAEIDAAQTGFPRTPFRKGNFFRGIQVSKEYGRDSQREAIARILNSDKLASEYIHETDWKALYLKQIDISKTKTSKYTVRLDIFMNPLGPYFFSRGHLIAKGDFIYGSHQRATFYYVNAVPMWQNINAGNWGTMEANVRSLASKRNMDLDVWVGGYGILTLKDKKSHEHEIFLHVNKNNRGSVPVPKILYKVVYNYPTQSGIVFLTANNPYLTNITKEYRICKDVCNKINYVTWNLKRPDFGLSYCCEIDDFRRSFPSIPNFETKHLLI